MSAMLVDTRPDGATAVVETLHPGRKRIVIVGGGFAGIAAAHALRHADAEVVLIDRRNHHIFQPLLYQVATAILSPAEIAAPIRQASYSSARRGARREVDMLGKLSWAAIPFNDTQLRHEERIHHGR